MGAERVTGAHTAADAAVSRAQAAYEKATQGQWTIFMSAVAAALGSHKDLAARNAAIDAARATYRATTEPARAAYHEAVARAHALDGVATRMERVGVAQ